MRIIEPPGPKRVAESTFWRKRDKGTIIPHSVEARIYTTGGVHLMTHEQDVAAQLLPGEKQSWQFGEVTITVERSKAGIATFDELRAKKQLASEVQP